MGAWEAVAWGLFGGLLVEVAGLYELRKIPSDEFPRHVFSKRYWIITALMVLIGGMLVLGYERSGASLSALLAVNIGASAPLLIGRLVGNVPSNLGRID
jgi:hypothetical protein